MDERFLDLLEGRIDSDQTEALQRAMELDQSLAKGYAEYRAVHRLAQLVSEADPMLDEDLSDSILGKIDSGQFSVPSISTVVEAAPLLPPQYRWWLSGLSAINTVLAVVLIVMLTNRGQLDAAAGPGAMSALQLAEQANATQVALVASQYPAYRAVPIDVVVPAERLMAAPIRLDMNVRLQQGAQQRVIELARFLPVIDVRRVAGNTETTLLVLVPEHLVERLNRARILGELDVSLITPVAVNSASDAPAVTQASLHPVYDTAGRLIADQIPSESLAVLYMRDKQSGAEMRHVLFHGDWLPDTAVSAIGF